MSENTDIEVVDGPVVGDGTFIEDALQPIVINDWKPVPAEGGILAELAAREAAADGTAPEDNSVVATNVNTLVQKAGGVDALEAMVEVMNTSDPVGVLSQVMSPEAKGIFLWSVVDDPIVAEQLLSDANVKQSISNKYFGGIDLDEVSSAVLDGYEPTEEWAAEQKERAEALAQASDAVNLAVFAKAGEDIAASYGLSLSNPSHTTMRQGWIREIKIFSFDHQKDIERAVALTAHGNKIQASAAVTRLSNKFSAYMGHLLNQIDLKPVKAKATTAATTEKAKESNSPSYDSDSGDFGREFAAMFKQAREERGL